MSLLTPDSGLLFWMVLSFGIVVIVLSKFGFPIIVKAIEDRKAYLDNSMENARKANEQLALIKEQGEQILSEAKMQHESIIKEAFSEKEVIISEARLKAQEEAQLQMENATRRINEEKQKAILEIRSQITDLSITIAEKILKEELSKGEKQQQIIDKLINDVTFFKS